MIVTRKCHTDWVPCFPLVAFHHCQCSLMAARCCSSRLKYFVSVDCIYYCLVLTFLRTTLVSSILPASAFTFHWSLPAHGRWCIELQIRCNPLRTKTKSSSCSQATRQASKAPGKAHRFPS